MGKNRLGKGHAIPVFLDTFRAALSDFSTKVVRTANIKHRGTKGTEREITVAELFGSLLPGRYKAACGEVVDLMNEASPQLDVLIFDRNRDFPFYSGDSVVLPAESLLASIEVKSKLNSGEIWKSAEAAKRLKNLRPFKKPLAGADISAAQDGNGATRYFHSLFAYDTDLSREDWLRNEHARVRKAASQADGRYGNIDLVYVLNRGLVNLNSGNGMLEEADTGRALVSFYFSILNFMDRESSRRPPTPYISYASELHKHWQQVR